MNHQSWLGMRMVKMCAEKVMPGPNVNKRQRISVMGKKQPRKFP